MRFEVLVRVGRRGEPGMFLEKAVLVLDLLVT